MSRLSSLGVQETEAIKMYVSKVCESSSWMRRQTVAGSMMDHNIILGAISQMEFETNTVVTTPNEAVKIMSTASKNTPVADEDVQQHTDRLKVLFTCPSDAVLIVPVTYSKHWGVVIASTRTGEIWWGDSLGFSPFLRVVEVVHKIMQKISHRVYTVQSGNFILDRLKYEKQEDGYSCGFYVVSAISHFADNIGNLPAFGYIKYSSDLSEKIRQSAVFALFLQVEQLYTHLIERSEQLDCEADRTRLWRQNFSECGLSLFICEHKLRFFIPTLPDTRRLLRLTKGDGLMSHGVIVENLDDFLEEQKSNLEFFQKHKAREIRPTAAKPYTKTVRYMCYRWRAKEPCKVVLTAYFNSAQNVWRVSKKNIHNHVESKPRKLAKTT